jgi:hypothetical protein
MTRSGEKYWSLKRCANGHPIFSPRQADQSLEEIQRLASART